MKKLNQNSGKLSLNKRKISAHAMKETKGGMLFIAMGIAAGAALVYISTLKHD